MEETRVKFRTEEGFKEGNVVSESGDMIHVEDDNGIKWKTYWHRVTIIKN